MDFWTRVDIEEATESQTATGNVQREWTTREDDVEARLLPLDTTEKSQGWATPEEDAYEVHLRGAWVGIRPLMRILAAGDYYDIRRVVSSAPFGEPVTVLYTVKVTP